MSTPCLRLPRKWQPWSCAATSSALFVLINVMLIGCGGPIRVERASPLPERTPPPAGIVVLPVAAMTHRADARETAFRSQQVLDWLLDHTEVPLTGPLEFRAVRPVDEVRIASADTDLATRTDERIDLRGWWAVQVLITENRAASQRQIVDTKVDKSGRTISQVGAVESALQMELTLRDAHTGRPLASAVVATEDDPSQGQLDGDPRPVLQRLLAAGLRALFGDALAGLQGPAARLVRAGSTLPSPKALASYETPGRPSFLSLYIDKSEAARDAAMYEVWNRLWADTPDRAVRAGSRHAGVLLRQDRAPLLAMDVITAVGDQSVADPARLDRLLRTCGTGCRVKVGRGRDIIELPLTWGPVARPEHAEP